jgi:hypothetical protein
MTFKALQGHSDGTIVRWVDISQPGQSEPEHPVVALATLSPRGLTTRTLPDGYDAHRGLAVRLSSAGQLVASMGPGR